jgi:hypothetical protein
VEASCEAAPGAKPSVTLGNKALAHEWKREGRRAKFVLREPVELGEGERLVVSI